MSRSRTHGGGGRALVVVLFVAVLICLSAPESKTAGRIRQAVRSTMAVVTELVGSSGGVVRRG